MRYRNSNNNPENSVNDDNDYQNATESENQSLILDMKKYKRGLYHNNLSCLELHELKPCIVGYLHKYSPSIWSYLFPCIFNSWKKRYFIVIGNYIYRFVTDHDDMIKGIPIPIDSININLNICQENKNKNNSYNCYIEISTIRKMYKLKAENIDEGNI